MPQPTRDQRQAIDGLIADAVDSMDARHYLSDILEELGAPVYQSVRWSAHLPGLICACRWGTADAVRMAARCRRELAAHARAVWVGRRSETDWLPETEPAPDPDWQRVSLAECEGSGRYRERLEGRYHGVDVYLRSYSHCYRLCERAWCGQEVPADVGEHLMVHVERAREALRDLGTVELAAEGSV